MAKRRRKKRGCIAAILEGVLSLIDWICETIAWLCVSALRGIIRLIGLALRGVWMLLGFIMRVLLYLPAKLWRRMTGRYRRASQCLKLDGEEFEAYVALVLHDNGFRNVECTRYSGDQGVDILAERNGKTYAIQCKNYADAVGNFAVQEAFAGCEYYGCDVAAVICPGTFTRSARELAESTGVVLWDGERLSHMMRVSGRKPKRRKAKIA